MVLSSIRCRYKPQQKRPQNTLCFLSQKTTKRCAITEKEMAQILAGTNNRSYFAVLPAKGVNFDALRTTEPPGRRFLQLMKSAAIVLSRRKLF